MPIAHPEDRSPRVRALTERVAGAPPIVMLTAYDAISARIAQRAGVDVILVGDSAATTVLGYGSTRDVSVEEMLMLTRAVRRGAPDGCLVGDLPFSTYEESDEQAVATARRFIDAGADLIKLEGAGEMASRLRAIANAGMPTVGHAGLLPQSARSVGDLKARGRRSDEALQIVRDSISIVESGASLLVIEAVPSMVAEAIVSRVRVPVIGIGAGSGVGGQVLVYPDLVGLTDGRLPRFVRTYANLESSWTSAVRAYAADVRSRAFPAPAEEYPMPEAERNAFASAVRALGPAAESSESAH